MKMFNSIVYFSDNLLPIQRLALILLLIVKISAILLERNSDNFIILDYGSENIPQFRCADPSLTFRRYWLPGLVVARFF